MSNSKLRHISWWNMLLNFGDSCHILFYLIFIHFLVGFDENLEPSVSLFIFMTTNVLYVSRSPGKAWVTRGRSWGGKRRCNTINPFRRKQSEETLLMDMRRSPIINYHKEGGKEFSRTWMMFIAFLHRRHITSHLSILGETGRRIRWRVSSAVTERERDK